MDYLEETTVFHITHFKAGSRWLHRILKRCVGERLLPVQADRAELFEQPIRPGRVYSACYARRDEIEALRTPPDSRRFVVMRDLRDTLISGYFSLKISHVTYQTSSLNRIRENLQDPDLEQGLLMTIRDWLPLNAAIQRSWLESGEPWLRYEDLLEDDYGILSRVLLDDCELGVSPKRLQKAIEAESFERLSGGRKRGEEDVTNHYRKGIAGDWRNYFSDRVRDEFKQHFGELLIETGYENGMDW